MKIKCNIPMLNKLKENIRNIKLKTTNNHNKTPIKYYALLILMVGVGIITFTSNLKRYNDINSENYIKYDLKDEIKVDSSKVENKIYDTAISSISTNVANLEEDDGEENKGDNIYIWPIKGEVIKEYATENLVYSKTLDMWRIHPGIDIASDLDEQVVAIKNGTIIEVKQDGFYGNTIKIEHDDGYISVYSNLDDISTIDEGTKVKQGDVIGKIGFSAHGEIEDESHLHFEVLKNNEWINPLKILE